MEPDEVRMTFSEHLEELRSCLIRALLGVLVLAVVALCFQGKLFDFFSRPYDKAREEIRANREAVLSLDEKEFAEVAKEMSKRDVALLAIERQARQLAAHRQHLDAQTSVLQEAVTVLRESGALSEARATEVSGVLQQASAELQAAPALTPEDLAPVLGHDIGPLQSVQMTEVFMSHIKVALLTAALFAAPWILFQLWQFVGAGLYDHERKVILRVFPFSVGLFGLGLLFGFFVLVPVSIHFLLSYGDPHVIEPAITVGSYLGLLFVMLFVMGLVFQIPLVMTVVSSLGLIDPKLFRTKRKYFLMGAIVMAAVLTPPDYITQVLVAIPMVVLYEFGVVLAHWAARKRQRKLAASEQEALEEAK